MKYKTVKKLDLKKMRLEIFTSDCHERQEITGAGGPLLSKEYATRIAAMAHWLPIPSLAVTMNSRDHCS